MNKGFLDDTFEKALEAGQSMAKSGGKQIKQTFNPLQMLKIGESEKGDASAPSREMQEKMKKEGNSTPLDFEGLQKNYGKQDEDKAKALAQRLFQMVKSGDEKVAAEKQREAEDKKRREAYAKEEKKRQEQVKARQADAEMPQGKERKSILGGKKKKSNSTPAPAEIKPSQGKQ